MGFTVKFMLGITLVLVLSGQLESSYLKRQSRQLNDNNKEIIIRNETKPHQNVQINKTLQSEEIKKIDDGKVDKIEDDIISKQLIPQENKPKTDVEKNTNLGSITVDSKNKIIPDTEENLKTNLTVVKLEKSEPYNKKIEETNIEKINSNPKVAATVQKNEVKTDQAKFKNIVKDKFDENKSDNPVTREENAKSLDIEKYVSKDFHNNVYTLPTSPDTEKYINYDYEHQSSTYHGPDFTRSFEYSAELTTPKTSLFDSRFKEAVDSVDQKLEHIDSILNESSDSKEISDVNIDKLYDKTKNNDSNAHLNYIHFNKIISNDTKDKNALHKDLEVEEIRNVDFRSSYNNTQIIDENPVENQNNKITKEINPVEGVQNENINHVVKSEKELGKTETTTNKNIVIKVTNLNNNNTQTVENPIENQNIKVPKEISSSESVQNENINQVIKLEKEIEKPETTTAKNVIILTTRKNIITKPTTNKNSSHISILSNKIETETFKSTNPIIVSNSITLPVSTTTERIKGDKEQVPKRFTKPIDITKRGSVKFSDYSKPLTTTQATTVRYRNRNKTIEQNKFNKTAEQLFQENQIIPVHIKAPEKLGETTTTTTEKTMTSQISIDDYKVGGYITEINEKLQTWSQPTTVPFETTTSSTDFTTIISTPTETFATTVESLETTTENIEASTTNRIFTTNGETDLNLEATATTVEPVSTTQSLEDTATTTQNTVRTTNDALNLQTTTILNDNSTILITTIEPQTSTTLEALNEVEKSTAFPKLNHSKNEYETTTMKTSQPTTMKTSQPTTENNLRTSKGLIFDKNISTTATTTTATAAAAAKFFENTSTAVPIKLETTTAKLIMSTSSALSNEVIKSNITVSSTTSTTKSNIDELITDYEDPDEMGDEDENRKDHVAVTTTTEIVFIHIENVDNHTTLLPEVFKPGYNYPTPSIDKSIDNKIPKTTFDENTTQTTSETDELVNPEDNSGTIAAIVISCVGAVCLIILAGLLFIMRKRQKRFNYGQRCTPVSLDDYSMDNISVYNSVRRKGILRSSKRSYGNPAFEDPASVSHPLNFPAVGKFANNFEDMKAEFEEIPQISARTNELPEGCDTKNRYANVIPLPETRVPLKLIDGYPNSDYINANYVTGPRNIKGYYIACQAPLQNTVDDFWRMIWEQQSKVILMLTHLFENGTEKSIDYLPPSEVLDCHRLFGDFQITLKKREVKDKYIISILQLKNMVSNSWREVTHLWYLGWPDKGIPSEANSLIAFLIEARSYMKTGPDKKEITNADIGNGSGKTELSPVVVHCSPGTGRTGVVIACDIAIREFEQNRLVDVPRIVYKIRRDRASSVQTKDQYAFIYKVISLYATKLTGGALDSL